MIAIENVRLFDEVQERTRELTESLEQQTATSEVSSVISSSPGDPQPVFEAMLANAGSGCCPAPHVLVTSPPTAMPCHGPQPSHAPTRRVSKRVRPNAVAAHARLHNALGRLARSPQSCDIPDAEERPAESSGGARNFLGEPASSRRST